MLVTASPASGLFVVDDTYDDPTITTIDQFGSAVAMSGDNVLIGAAGDDTNGENVGQAHLFGIVSGTMQTFNDPTITSSDFFGTSVAIDGNNVLIGARGDDTAGLGVGQAYLFDAISGNLLRTFNDPTVTSGDGFGTSVSINGSNVLIGSPGDDTNGENVGQAYLFDAINGNLLQTFNDPTVTNADEFGASVVISGGNVLIGARRDDTNGSDVGQAHLFATSGNLLQTFDDPTVTTTDEFGTSVAINGNNVLIGAPLDDTSGLNVGQAHLFDAVSGDPLQTFEDPTIATIDRFGFSVAIDGDKVLIGARTDSTNGFGIGQAHMFDVVSGDLEQTLDDPTVTTIDEFGYAVAIDGDRALVGARTDSTNGFGVGQAYLFEFVILFGDANNDLIVSGADLIAVQQNFGDSEPGEPTGLLLGDANDDGFTSGADLIIVQQNFGAALAPLPVAVLIPEPVSSALGVLLFLGILHRRPASSVS